VKYHIWSTAFYGAEMWALRKSFEMWCWRRMEKIGWSNRVRHEEVLQRVKTERNILPKIKRRKVAWIGHILHVICLLKYVIKGKIEGSIDSYWKISQKRQGAGN
jgi:hypothetical protein